MSTNFRQADLNHKESLVNALRGSHTAYGVTNYWEKADMELEIQQGKNIADAAKEVGIQHYIWSTLLNINKLSSGKLAHVYHFDSKAQVAEYCESIGLPTSFFMPGFYMPNIPGGMFKPSESGEWTFALPIDPKCQIPLYDPRDTGKYVKAIVLHRESMLGKRMLGASQYLSAQGVVDEFTKVYPTAGRLASFYRVPERDFKDQLRRQGNPEHLVDELYENMRLMEEFGYFGGAALNETHGLVEDHLTTWTDFIRSAAAFQGLE
jgi:uncharacterized protein YbjT (DUF2867 family)